MMDATRAEARRLVREGVVLITRGDAVLDPDTFKGVCRLRLNGDHNAAAASASVNVETTADDVDDVVVGGVTTKKRKRDLAGVAPRAGTDDGDGGERRRVKAAKKEEPWDEELRAWSRPIDRTFP